MIAIFSKKEELLIFAKNINEILEIYANTGFFGV